MPPVVGVCSWSLQPDGPEDLAAKVRKVRLKAVQLELDPLRDGAWDVDGTVACLRDAGIEIRSGMIRMRGEDYSTLETIRETGGVRSDHHWEANLAGARAGAELAAKLGLNLVTFHAGFLPEANGDPVRATMLERLRAIADAFAEHDVRAGLETGQESADTLLGVLDELDRPNVGVNFDPANMVLYGMGDPTEALRKLASRVFQIHIKDASATDTPGTWGREKAVGKGEVDWAVFFAVQAETGIRCDLMIEREAGAQRSAEIAEAAELVRPFV